MPKGSRKAFLASIVSTIADYRQGEIPTPDSNHLDRWIGQFDRSVQEPMLAEVDHVLKTTYLSKPRVESFLNAVLKEPRLAGAKPREFWSKANFLDIQIRGNSQREMLAMLRPLLLKATGLDLSKCGSSGGPFLYLDDGIFSGGHVQADLLTWIQKNAPKSSRLHIVVIALHRQGEWLANKAIKEAASACGKSVNVTWWRILHIENRKSYTSSSEVLRPTSIPDDKLVKNYVKSLGSEPVLRQPGGVGANGVFSSETGRTLLEQEFLKAGAYIRTQCPNLNEYQRPLGNTTFKMLGFGALVVTFRNCANNCPLVFWVDAPWYPLFPRKTNR